MPTAKQVTNSPVPSLAPGCFFPLLSRAADADDQLVTACSSCLPRLLGTAAHPVPVLPHPAPVDPGAFRNFGK